MPLITSSFETLADDIKAAPSSEVYVLFSGAKNEKGESWCPPCQRAAPDFKRVFEDNENAYTLVVYVKPEDFETNCWPQREWAVVGVPMVYRLKDGELSGAFVMHGDVEFGEALDNYVLGEDKYEAWLLEKQGDEYVDPATRFEWLHEDFARYEEEGKANKVLRERRKKVKEAQAAKRKAAKGEDDAVEGESDEKKAKLEGGVCNGVTCSA